MRITPEINAIVISFMVLLIPAGVGAMVAWLRAKTKQLNEIVERTNAQALANRELLEKNTQISKNIERRTDGLNKQMQAIAAAAAFTKGRVQGRAEGESDEPYEELDRLENEYDIIIHKDFAKPKFPEK